MQQVESILFCDQNTLDHACVSVFVLWKLLYLLVIWKIFVCTPN